MDGDNTSNDDLAAFDAPRPAPLAALAEEHARAVDAECAAYLAAHGDEMRAELAAAASGAAGGRAMIADTVARCGTCGSRYSSRAWPWLEALDGTGDRRACPVPGCGAMLARGNVARGCGCVAANDGQREGGR